MNLRSHQTLGGSKSLGLYCFFHLFDVINILEAVVLHCCLYLISFHVKYLYEYLTNIVVLKYGTQFVLESMKVSGGSSSCYKRCELRRCLLLVSS